MKVWKKLLTMGIAAALVFSALACKDTKGNGEQKYDPETRPLVMSLSQPDGVFNPFFSTALPDSTVISMTQVSMLSSDEKGNVVCGDNEPTVVKDYRTVLKHDANGDVETTTYEFIIKNGIKFSDGTPLTIKDVLFNLYVYLDPAYTGSSTIYSTDIVGLKNYRLQKKEVTDGEADSFEQSFVDEASQHITDLVEFVKCFGRFTGGVGEEKPTDRWEEEQKKQRRTDVATVAKLFREELYTDWNTTLGNMESYKDWGFTQPWQVFLLNDGQMSELLQTRPGTDIPEKDEEGNYKLDEESAADLQKELDAFIAKHSDMKADEAAKEWAVNTVFGNYFPSAVSIDTMDYVEDAFGKDQIANTIETIDATLFDEIVHAWATADTLLTQFAAEAKTAYFAGLDRVVPTISGINGKTTVTKDYSGKDLGEAHSVLSVTINGVDPKAIWNFGFIVAPMHYYSGTYTPKNGKTKDYVAAFDESKGEFGLEFGDINFMNNVINAPSKVGLPLGAGVYKASRANGGAATSGDEFKNLNILYYERNEYFTTLGSGIENAKIKYFRYSVVDPDQIINTIATKAIDVGDPNATQDNISMLNDAGIKHEEIYANGYGYVGINPRFVPHINVRRAIIKAMDLQSIINDYYQGGLATPIYRSMTTQSWAYPVGATVYESRNGTSYAYDALGQEIEQLVKDADYELKGGVYEKSITGFGVDRLDYQFTIAGSTKDHPLYNVFMNAAKILNKHGFAIKVVNSATALSDLTTGKLAVWAAAWSSAIDPDLYQVYHIDSQATSVNNWGYKQIKANSIAYSTELALVQELSEYIDEGRSYDDSTKEGKDLRKAAYADALDVIMELAVELPAYQRMDMTAFNGEVINEKTLVPPAKRSPYNGLFARIWEVNYN